MDEDTQPVSVPIIQPVVQKAFEYQEKSLPETCYPVEFLQSLMENQARVRNVALVGHLHSGKTCLADLLIEQAHKLFVSDPGKPSRYLDSRKDEVLREISVKASPISLILPDKSDKSWVINLIDTPGHPGFYDEVCAAVNLVDGVFLVVDVIEGVMLGTDKLLRHVIAQGLPVVLVLNKIDRFVLELKIPPQDTYYKLKHTIDQLNSILSGLGSETRFLPSAGNVLFASGLYGFVFNTLSMAAHYSALMGRNFEVEEFSKRLWGNLYFDAGSRRFSGKVPENKTPGDRSFVEFIMTPLYKLIGYTVSEERSELEKVLKEVGVYLKKACYELNTNSLVKVVCGNFFGRPTGIVDAAARFFKPPNESQKFCQLFEGDRVGEGFNKVKAGQSTGPVVVHLTKQYHDNNCENFFQFGRVLSGTLKSGDELIFINEKYSPKDSEHKFAVKISDLFIYNTRYKYKVSQVPAGNFVLIPNLDNFSSKFSTLFDKSLSSLFSKSLQVKFCLLSPIKLALEPLNPSDLPKMLEGLRKCSKSYPLLDMKMYETGEHMIFGTTELYLDSILHDLRELYSDIEVKLSDPSVILTETVIETSSFKAFSQTPNNMNKVSMIAEPLEASLASAIQSGALKIDDPLLPDKLETNYSWDILASNNLWAFGPEREGSNVLINDILPYELDPEVLGSKSSIVQGFQWACKEGPLCEEPIRGVKFRIIEASLAHEAVYKAPGQLIPVTRRVCYSSFLLATPRLMEPYYLYEVQCSKDCIQAIYTLLQRRRGHVKSEEPKPGTPLYTIMASLPVIDSFGFETDLRTYTSGMAFCVCVFDQWALVPGDPLDKKIVLRPLEPSPAPALARDFMVKTRNRKGLTEDVIVSKYFDHPVLYEMAKADLDLAPYFN